MSPVRIPPNVGDFRLVDWRAVEVLRQLPERNRFMKGLFAWVGFNSIGVAYERPQRAAGTTKFNLLAAVELRAGRRGELLDRAAARLVLCRRGDRGDRRSLRDFIITRVLILGIDTPGYASLLIAVLLLGAIQLLSLGIIGEYLGRLFLEVKGRPIYVVEGVYEDGADEPPKA